MALISRFGELPAREKPAGARLARSVRGLARCPAGGPARPGAARRAAGPGARPGAARRALPQVNTRRMGHFRSADVVAAPGSIRRDVTWVRFLQREL
jgi:hypothetical protein